MVVLRTLRIDASDINTRRFYYPPDVALIIESGQAPYLSIVAASGYRAHPLNQTIHDRMYMMRMDDYLQCTVFIYNHHRS